MIDVIDETFVVASPDRVASALGDPTLWSRWWPELTLTVFEDRASRGIRWTVTGALVGSKEFWLEPVRDGVLVHYYLRADLTTAGSSTDVLTGRPGPLSRRCAREVERRRLDLKRRLNVLKDDLEADRAVGTPREADPAGD